MHRKRAALVMGATVLLGVGLGVASAATAQAAGDTPRQHGCAAHWRNTASWNECINAPGLYVQLQAECKLPIGTSTYVGPWRWVKGSIDPSDRHECRHHVNKAEVAFRF